MGTRTNATTARVLVGAVDVRLGVTLAETLAGVGLLTSLGCTSAQVVEHLAREHFELVIVDEAFVGDPRGSPADGARADGLSRVVASTTAPVVALSRDATAGARLLAEGASALLPYEATADDVVLLATSFLFHRVGRATDGPLRCGALELDVERRQARFHGRDLALTRLQFRLLETLAAADGAVVSRAELQRSLYGRAELDDGERVVAHVRRIRSKLEEDPSHPQFLRAVRGEGFRLVP
jgi:DNA-binding response OmpR family regulator